MLLTSNATFSQPLAGHTQDARHSRTTRIVSAAEVPGAVGLRVRRSVAKAVTSSTSSTRGCNRRLPRLGHSNESSYHRTMGSDESIAETAYYYPEPYWPASEGGWIKSLLLFFDEVAILLPSYMRGR